MIFTNIFCRSTGMTTISVQTFNKLAQESVELIKTRETIKKLENIIREMAKKNTDLVKQIRKEISTYISVCTFCV